MAQLGKKTCQITEVLKQTEGLSMSQPVNQRRIQVMWQTLAAKIKQLREWFIQAIKMVLWGMMVYDWFFWAKFSVIRF